MLTKRIITFLGVVLILVGLGGFVWPNFVGMHLSATHNIIHLVSGALAIYFGTVASIPAARTFGVAFGIVYLSLGVAGYAFGDMTSPAHPADTVTPAPATLPPALPGNVTPPVDEDEMIVAPPSHHVWRVIPGTLEFSDADHVVHILVGFAFLIGGMARARSIALPPRSARPPTTSTTTTTYTPPVRKSA